MKIARYEKWVFFSFFLAVSGLTCGMWAPERVGSVVEALGLVAPRHVAS